MIHVSINGLSLEVEKGTTILEAARFVGFPIPTLCHEDGLRPYGACRLCVVEIGEAPRSKLVASCTYRVEEGLKIRTDSIRVQRARRLLLELYVATSPLSKRIQDLASANGVHECRYDAEPPRLEEITGSQIKVDREGCIQCGLCVRMCNEQMMAGAIGFSGRGVRRRVARPFEATSELCRQCGACLYICPVCELRCAGPQPETTLCSGCLNFSPVCFQSYDDAMCFLTPCHGCELSGPFRADVKANVRDQKFVR
jgi:NADH dehydrogenase/NADH:ubiquinone oxidoreductase subunit G